MIDDNKYNILGEI